MIKTVLRQSMPSTVCRAVLAGYLFFASSVFGQSDGAAKSQPSAKSPMQDFDYLLGEWKFRGVNKQFGKVEGVWSAVQISRGVILDVYKVLGEKGEIYYKVVTVRAFNKERNQWDFVSGEGGRGLLDVGSGQRKGDELHVEQRFGVGTPNQFLFRIRYFNIGTDGFSWVADRSDDGGVTWTKDFQRLDVRRTGPAKPLGWLGSQTDPTAEQ